MAPPEEPLTTARGTACDPLWLGPGEGLAAAVEVGDGSPGLELSGPRAFAAGQATRTRLGRSGVLLRHAPDRPGEGLVSRLYVERSWAVCLWSWLADAALDHATGDDAGES